MKRPLRAFGLLEAIAIGLTLAACVAAPTPEPSVGGGPAKLSGRTVPLDPRDPTRVRIGELTYLGGAQLIASGTSRFHGLSDMFMWSDADEDVSVIAITDDGDIIGFGLDPASRAPRVRPYLGIRRLVDLDGRPLQGKTNSDAEAIAFLGDGEPTDYLIAFERRHRIERYADSNGTQTARPHGGPDEMRNLPENEGIEALTELPLSGQIVLAVGAEDGRIWFCDLERPTACTVFRAAGGPERGYSLTALRDLPGTADMIALYRAYDPIRGMRCIVARVRTGVVGRAGIDILARLERPLTVDNFEGLEVGGNPREGWTLYLLSDDNFSASQRTLLLAFDYTPAETAP